MLSNLLRRGYNGRTWAFGVLLSPVVFANKRIGKKDWTTMLQGQSGLHLRTAFPFSLNHNGCESETGHHGDEHTGQRQPFAELIQALTVMLPVS